MKKALLTVQEAADFVGVSSSTLKRLCGSESVPVLRTPGGHRRIDKVDLDRIATSFASSSTRSSCHGIKNFEITHESVLANLMEAKPVAVANLLSKSTHSGDSLISALEDYLVATLWKVGQMWRDGVIDIYQEHICTNSALTVIDILRQRVTTEPNSTYVAIGGSVGSSHETLASKLVSLCLSLIGITSVDLGCALPPASLALAATDFNAKFVWVTHTHVTDVDFLLAWHQELKDLLPTKTRVIIGGGGLSPAIRRSLPWCEYYETVSEMTRIESSRLVVC